MKISTLFRKKPIQHLIEDHSEHLHTEPKLERHLTRLDLTSFGIAAIVGAGIFGTIGTAAQEGGPAIVLLFLFTAIACTFSALCYAEFASRIPISGSAYTYAYATFGELVAWIIGWTLIMEYAIGNIAVAISWSDYFTSLVNSFGWHIPEYLSVDYLSASRGHEGALELIKSGQTLEQLSPLMRESYFAWESAPNVGGLRVILDIPAFTIVFLVTWLVYIGIRETKNASNAMVLLKLLILMLVIGVGAYYVNPENWSPFAPNGFAGIMKGTAGVFFAYMGFDAISTTAEECKNPQKDLPRAMISSLLICTVLYVVIALVLTGMVSYKELGVGDPLAYVFLKLKQYKMVGIISVSAVIAMTSVLIVYQLGQPRIWMNMSRDGLLPKRFSVLHKRYNTPGFATIITGIVVAVPTLFMNLTEVTSLSSIGTLFAFVLVCGGVLVLEEQEKDTPQNLKFKIPYFNSRFYLPPIVITILALILYFNIQNVISFFHFFNNDFYHKIPMLIYIPISMYIMYLSLKKQYSLIPVLGLLTNFYLMTELGVSNWVGFFVWLVIGIVIYFLYGYRKSIMQNHGV